MDQNDVDLCCPICLSQYAIKVYVPRILNCGHTQCEHCISNIIKTSKSCGECRAYIKAVNVKRLPINYTVLRVIDSLKGKQEHNLGLQELKKLDEKINDVLKDQDKYKALYSVHILCSKLNIAKDEELKHTLESTKHKMEPLMKQIPMLKGKNERLNTLLECTCKRIEYYERRVRNLQSKIKKIDSLKNDQVKARTQLTEQFRVLSNCSSLAQLSSLIAKTEDIMKAYEKKFLFEVQSDITEESVLPILENPAKYFIKHKENSYSSVFLHSTSGKVMMKCVQSSVRPIAGAASKFINFCDVSPYATGAYLQVESEGLIETLEIELYDNRRSQLFAFVCSGVHGPSLFNTFFFNSQRVGLEGENISFGVANFSKKLSTQTLLTNLTSLDTEHKNIKSRDLVGVGIDNALFQLYLEDWPPKHTDHCFGRLLTGHEFLRTNVRNGDKIKIADCGLVFDFNKSVDKFRLDSPFITSLSIN